MGTPVIGVDVGGTETKLAVVENGEILYRRSFATQAGDTSPTGLLGRIGNAITEMIEEAGIPLHAVGLVMPGPTNGGRGIVYNLTNVPGWERAVEAAAILQRQLHVPVTLDNDANAAASAHFRFGRARGTKNFVYVTISTGIGGEAFVNGRIQRGTDGIAGEFGHWILQPGGPICGCGQRGHWEALSSGSAIAREARDRQNLDMDARQVADQARDGAVWAQEIFRDAAMWTGVGLINLVAAYNPELVIVGGGVSKAEDLLLNPARDMLRNLGIRAARDIPVERATLEDAGIIGAAALAFEGLENQ